MVDRNIGRCAFHTCPLKSFSRMKYGVGRGGEEAGEAGEGVYDRIS